MPTNKESSVVSRQSSDKNKKQTVVKPATKKVVAEAKASRSLTTKAVVKKAAPKVEKVEAKAVVTAPKKTVKSTGGVNVPMYSMLGKAAGEFSLPAEIFGAKVNTALLSQALRVYINNQKSHWGDTKTRGEVAGTTHKAYAQKGTGGARHGSRRAPIFVHGGIAMGPKFRKMTLDLPQKMRQAALISALSQKTENKQIMVVDFAKSQGKTKEMASLMKTLNLKSVLLLDGELGLSARIVRNLQNVEMVTAGNVSAYDAIRHTNILLTESAVAKLQERMAKKETKNA